MVEKILTDRCVAEQIYEDFSRLCRKLSGHRVSAVVPAYNEGLTVGKVVAKVLKSKYVDEVIVADDGSTDRTSLNAQKAGARTVRHGKNMGKGNAMRSGLAASTGSIVLFVDADNADVSVRKLDSLVKPVVMGEADFTKASFTYKRPSRSRYLDWDKKEGRVTKLAVRPLLKVLFPEINLQQPIGGYYCARREFFEKISFESDYGVDIGILIDAVRQSLRITEVDIGKITNPDRAGNSARMSENIISTILRKHGFPAGIIQ